VILQEFGTALGAAVAMGTSMAIVFATFRGKSKNDTIETLERLVGAMRAESEHSQRAYESRISILEGRVDALQSDFASSIASAIVGALPEAWHRMQDADHRSPPYEGNRAP
jgi:hypothetical protein